MTPLFTKSFSKPSPPTGGRGEGEGGFSSSRLAPSPRPSPPVGERGEEFGGSRATVPALELRAVRRVFKQAGTELVVLDGIDLVLRPGEAVALVGPSGAGKSTLLHIAGLLERPDAGAVLIGGRECGSLPDERRTLMRRCELGFVYQFHHLLPEFSALENIMLAQMIAGLPRRRAREKAALLLDRVGLARRAGHRPARLSGGEQQRVAIARALANDPKVLLGDEPTGNLDHASADSVAALLIELVRHTGLAALIATHNLDLARRLDRIVALEGGRLRPAE